MFFTVAIDSFGDKSIREWNNLEKAMEHINAYRQEYELLTLYQGTCIDIKLEKIPTYSYKWVVV